MSDEIRSGAPQAAPEQLQTSFLAVLPTIVLVAQIYFRQIRCPHTKDDLVAEAVALGWRWHVRLAERGRDPSAFVVTLARYAARAVACGRRLCGKEKSQDAMSFRCQRRGGFVVVSFPRSSIWASVIQQALRDNTQSAVWRQVQFRIDFCEWVRRLPEKKQQILGQLALGERTQTVARMVGVSAARISQVRGELRHDYLHFVNGTASARQGAQSVPHVLET